MAVNGDIAEAEHALRKSWGGALCVSLAGHTEAELRGILDEVIDSHRDQLLTAATGQDRVHLMVVHDDGSLQRVLDQRYSPGLVVVGSALQRYQPHAGWYFASPDQHCDVRICRVGGGYARPDLPH